MLTPYSVTQLTKFRNWKTILKLPLISLSLNGLQLVEFENWHRKIGNGEKAVFLLSTAMGL
jgi:hypothetical protein